MWQAHARKDLELILVDDPTHEEVKERLKGLGIDSERNNIIWKFRRNYKKWIAGSSSASWLLATKFGGSVRTDFFTLAIMQALSGGSKLNVSLWKYKM